MQQITTELLLHVAMGVHNNAITSQETHSQAFVVFFIAVQGYLCSQANLVAIWQGLCKHYA